jgi:hypothetical protein
MSDITLQEKQEIMLKSQIKALEEILEEVKKDLKNYPEAFKRKVINSLYMAIERKTKQLKNIYQQQSIF